MSDETGPWVYEEISVSLPNSGEFSGFTKVTYGHGRLSPSTSNKDLEKTTRKVQAWNDKIVTRRIKALRKAMREMQ